MFYKLLGGPHPFCTQKISLWTPATASFAALYTLQLHRKCTALLTTSKPNNYAIKLPHASKISKIQKKNMDLSFWLPFGFCTNKSVSKVKQGRRVRRTSRPMGSMLL